MTGDPADQDLHGRFRALREHDLAALPEFERVLARAAARAQRARPAPMRAWAAGGGVAAAALALWLILGRQAAPPDLDPVALPGWRTPTDSLLAGASDPFRSPSWATLPTAGLGRPSFNRSRENR